MSGEKVLIIDDSRVSRMMVSAIIRHHHPMYEIIEAENGDDALIKADGQNLSRIIVDYNMPGIDGIQLAQSLIQKHPDARITLLTANIQSSIQQKAGALGIGFISKPISEEKICSIFAPE